MYPEMLGNYLLVERIGAGGMGEVHLGFTRSAGGILVPAAVKIMRSVYGENNEVIVGFRNEAKLLSKLQHGSVGRFYSFGVAGATSYIAMEFIEGVSVREILDACIADERRLPPAMALDLVSEVVRAMAYLERFEDPETGSRHEIFHGDLSPQNMIVTFEAELKLIDFGLAKLNQMSLEAMNSNFANMCYISPTRLRTRQISGNDDRFAVGVIFWELLNNTRYHGDASTQTIRMALSEFDPQNVTNIKRDIPGSLRAIVAKCLDDGIQGYGDAKELYEDLQRALKSLYPSYQREELREYLEANFSKNRDQIRSRLRNAFKVAQNAFNQSSRPASGSKSADSSPQVPAVAATPEKTIPLTKIEPARRTDSRIFVQERTKAPVSAQQIRHLAYLSFACTLLILVILDVGSIRSATVVVVDRWATSMVGTEARETMDAVIGRGRQVSQEPVRTYFDSKPAKAKVLVEGQVFGRTPVVYTHSGRDELAVTLVSADGRVKQLRIQPQASSVYVDFDSGKVDLRTRESRN